MKALRYLAVLFSISAILIIQSCGGGGGGSTDTAGALTMSAPATTDNKDGSFSVTTTVTYAPPAGKTAQGVVVTTTQTNENSVIPEIDNHTFTSGSNSVTYTYRVFQRTGLSTAVSIVSNIGSMKAGVFVVLAPITPLSASNIQFTNIEPSGTAKSSAIAGGIEPYSVLFVSTTDLVVSIAGKTLNVLNNTSGATPATGSIVITDQIGSLLTVNVGYFTP